MNEDELQQEYDAEMEKLDQYINDAFEHLEQAQSELFLKRNVFSAYMSKAEFDELILSKIKEML